MSDTFSRARSVAIWWMFMLTVGAWHIVSGAEMTVPNGVRLAAACIGPPLLMWCIWRRATSALPIVL